MRREGWESDGDGERETETRRRAGCGRCWAGWVGRVGPGENDQAWFSGPGQLGGGRGRVHIKAGRTTGSWHGPTLPGSAGLCSLMCGGGGEPSLLGWPCRLWCTLGPQCPQVSPAALVRGWDSEWGWLEAPAVGVRTQGGRLLIGGAGSGDTGCRSCHTYSSQPVKVQLHPSPGPSPTHCSEAETKTKWPGV